MFTSISKRTKYFIPLMMSSLIFKVDCLEDKYLLYYFNKINEMNQIPNKIKPIDKINLIDNLTEHLIEIDKKISLEMLNEILEKIYLDFKENPKSYKNDFEYQEDLKIKISESLIRDFNYRLVLLSINSKKYHFLEKLFNSKFKNDFNLIINIFKNSFIWIFYPETTQKIVLDIQKRYS